MDYYQILEIKKDASQADIAKNYRRLALLNHPELSKQDQNTSYRKFCAIAESYEVLSNESRKKVYDLHGYESLKNGVVVDDQVVGYAFQGNPEQIFESFFGSKNPYTQLYDQQEEFGSLLSYAYQNNDFRKIQEKEDLVVEVEVDLQELYNGCRKEVSYKREQLAKDGKTVEVVQNKYILPGYADGSKIYYNEMGNEAFGQKPSNLVFVVKEKPHHQFKRQGNDLIYTQNITLAQALLSEPISIVKFLKQTCFDGRKILFSIDQVISPQCEKLIENEGMPILDHKRIDLSAKLAPYKKGNLKIVFDIEFPKVMKEEDKIKLTEILA